MVILKAVVIILNANILPKLIIINLKIDHQKLFHLWSFGFLNDNEKGKRKGKTESGSEAKIEFPWFLIGFIMMSLFGSYVLGHAFTIQTSVMNSVSFITTFILTMAMIGLG
jgi:uncharacterized membrane protein YadS